MDEYYNNERIMQDTTTTTSASAVFRQLRAAPVDAASHAAQLDLVRQLVEGRLELHLPRKARARALLEWAAGRCAAKDGPNTPSSILDPEYWNLFSQILSLKDDTSIPSVSSSAPSIRSEEASNLLSKSDIRQIVLLSKGISLLNALRACLESIPSLLSEVESIPAQQSGDSSIKIAILLKNLHLVFARLFPLSLSSPNTTLDGLLPCIHAFVRSSSSLTTSPSPTILPQWTQVGQLLSSTLSSLLKTSSNNVQSATASDKLLLRKVASSFLDQSGGYANWKSFMTSYSIMSQLSHEHDETAPSSKGKGKARAQQQISTFDSTSTIAGATPSKSAQIKLLLEVFDGFITTSILSPANLARYFSLSSGSSLDTPKQAQDALSELFTALKASIRDTSSAFTASFISSFTSTSSSNVSTSTIHVLPRLVHSYIDTLTSHSHDLFAPLRRGGRSATDTSILNTSGTSTSASNNGASSRSAVEYQVQASFRNAVFGMLQGCVQLLKDASASTSSSSSVAGSNDKSTSPRKRQRDASSGNAPGISSSSENNAHAIRLILSQIQERNIYITGGGVANRAWHKILQDTAQFAVEGLLNDSIGQEKEADGTVTAAMQAITHIAKMDYTALEDVLPTLLEATAHPITTPQQEAYTQSCNDLMESALSYNGKIRQLPTFITKIEEAISAMIDEAASKNEDNDAAAFVGSMDSLFRSPLLSRHTSARLSKECKASLGVTQALPLLKSLLEKVNTLVIQVQQENQEELLPAQPPKKKSKQGRASLGGAVASSSVLQDATAWKIYSTSQVVQAILASGILTQAAAASAPASVEDSEVNGQFAALQESQMKLLEGITGKRTAAQRTEVALLRVCDAWRAAQEEENGAGNTGEYGELLNALTDSKTSTPSLRLEIVRSLLSRLASTTSHSQAEDAHKLFDHITSILASATQDSKAWDGHLHNLAESELPTAVWWLVATKYMDVAEQSASETQLEDVVKFIFSHSTNLLNAHINEVSIPSITGRLLRSADFFELQRIRAATAKYIIAYCESAEIEQSHLEILLLLPREYMDRSTKRRIVTTLSSQSDTLGDSNTMLALLKYTRDDPGNPLIKDLNFLKQLIDHNTVERSNHSSQLYEQLWTLMLQNWSASPERFTGLPDLLESLKPGTNGTSDTLLFATWRILATEAKASSVPPQVLDDLKTRVRSLQIDTQDEYTSIAQMRQQLQASITMQTVARWLQTADGVDSQTSTVNEDKALLAKKAVASLLQHADGSEQDLNSTLYLALELASMNLSSTLLDFEAFVVIFWLLAQKFGLQDSRFNTLLAKTCSAQSEEAYQSAVSTISEAVSPNVNPQALAATLQTLAVLLCNPPETATRVASQAFSATLRRVTLLKAGLSLSSLSAIALEAITSFVKAFLEQRIGVPEVHDVAAIWSILHDILTAGNSSSITATPHSPLTATNIFLNSIDIVSLLATHRRDHIIPTFPQFCRILNDILQLLRLSGVSSSSSTIATAAQFPAWSLVHHGSWIHESKCGKAVARLLLGLGTRTTVLQRSSARNKGAASASVVSLSGPLSKHAPFILVNYLTAATDSRFAMSPAMRKEINPGVLEILSTMGKSEREALMKGYLHDDQEAERVLLRVMWKEFDSVRYKGD